MKSPFPGMDPFLELHWGDVHHRLVQYACDRLQPELPRELVARVEERVFLDTQAEPVRRMVPNVHVSQVLREPAPAYATASEEVLPEPLVFDLRADLTSEGYLEIRESSGSKVITVIEFLSPSNKMGGVGTQKYVEKQNEVLQSDASLVEIDLVRAGRRVLALDSILIPAEHRQDYLACISPGWLRDRRELYVMPMRKRLPLLPIPLRQSDKRVNHNLQALVEQVYAAGRYSNLDYRTKLEPPLSPDDAAWATELLAQSKIAS